MYSSTLFFYLGIITGMLGAILAFALMTLTAWAMVDFIILS